MGSWQDVETFVGLGGVALAIAGGVWVRINGMVRRRTGSAPAGSGAAWAVLLAGWGLIGLAVLAGTR